MYTNEKSFDEMDYLERVRDTMECCGIFGSDAILEWDNMTKEEIVSFLQEYSNNALQECPLDHIPERADIILDVLEKRKAELEQERKE